MNVYISKVNGLSLESPLQYKQWLVADIAHGLSCREMGIFCYNGSAEGEESLRSRLDGILAGLSWKEDIVICQFPTGNGLRFERELINRLKVYQIGIIIFINDSKAIVCESNRTILPETIRLYNQADVLIVPSLMMRQFLLDNGIRKNMKFVIQEMWDYTMDMNFLHFPQLCREIHYMESEFKGIDDWCYDVPLNIYASSVKQKQNIHYLGKLSEGELVSNLSKGGFGLVWYHNADSQRGMEYGNSFELVRYLAAGIPVIVPVGISNQSMIEKNNLGLVVDSIEDAVRAVEAVTEKEYQRYIQNVTQFASILRGGYYTKKCLIDAIHAIGRKDAGKISNPAKVYDLGMHKFTYTVLRESYSGNFAFSWCYCGEADGFLIYDTLGKLIYETGNIHEHYFQIKGDGKENGFIVKAYVDTMKGKMIIEESKPTYLNSEKIEHPGVSIIMPAYNAEAYIARSIDTALAQSFPGFELIIVDDGSTDHTPDIIDWYAAHYANVVVIHQKNGGVPVARNTGIEYAKGDYIGFMDNDDMLRPDMAERMYKSAEKNHCDVVITSVYQITNNGHEIYMQYSMKEDRTVTVEDFFKQYYIRECRVGVVVWNKLYRASIVKVHLFPNLVFDDEAWTPYILSFADKICYLNDFLYEYDRIIRDATLVNKWWDKSKEERFMDYKKILMFYLKNGNVKRLGLLKELAWNRLNEMIIVYEYDEYEKLQKQIEEDHF